MRMHIAHLAAEDSCLAVLQPYFQRSSLAQDGIANRKIYSVEFHVVVRTIKHSYGQKRLRLNHEFGICPDGPTVFIDLLAPSKTTAANFWPSALSVAMVDQR